LTGEAARGYEGERMRPLALAIAAALLGAAGPAAAAPAITLNGVPIDGVTSQRFDNCTVVIDDKGNLDIQARGYAVKGAEAPRKPVQPQTAGSGDGISARPPSSVDAGRVSRRYFLVTEQTPPGPQFDLAIFINAQWIREVKSSEPALVMEITKYLRPGANKLTLAATKRLNGERLAFTRDVELRVVVGEGNVGGDHVMIDLPLVEMARTAVEMDDKTEEFVIDAR
jgi:hypothetical protein